MDYPGLEKSASFKALSVVGFRARRMAHGLLLWLN
jgi:hypothetical protein